ncbi:MAG: hypothetical protein GWP19_00160 [Planctomycetia bacterium]|nr:hypothetical protein [Planctomycetia bacterium]
MKKILFTLLLITMAFSQFDNTINGWVNGAYYVPDGIVYSEGVIVVDEGTLAAESLSEVDFVTHANWDVTNDFDDTGGNAAFIWSANQTSTLTQIQANLAVAGVGSRWYKFTYTLAVTTAFDGDAAATITTSFALSAVSLEIVTAGTYTIYFKSAVTPTDFVISLVSGTDTEGTISYDDVTLKEITGGDIDVQGLYTGGGSGGIKVLSNGNVGIGTVTPLSKLNVKTVDTYSGTDWKNDGKTLRITADTLPILEFYSEDGNDALFLAAILNGNNDMDFTFNYQYAGASVIELMRLDGVTGNLGIGTAAPVNLLNVDGAYNFFADSSSVNDSWGFSTTGLEVLTTGMSIYVQIAVANTDGATLQINALGAKAVNKLHDQALITGDVEVNQILHLVYDGTAFQMLSQLAQ